MSKPENQLISKISLRTIGAIVTCIICCLSSLANGASLHLEGYSYNPISKRISEIGHNVDVYANGLKIITDGLCTQKEPCKIKILKKSVLTLCSKSFEGVCQTNIRFDPSDSEKQRFAYVFSTSTYYATYTVYRPEEMPVIDSFLAKQGEEEVRMNEIKSKPPF